MGQTRLVTNGSKFSDQNNQPLITDKIIDIMGFSLILN